MRWLVGAALLAACGGGEETHAGLATESEVQFGHVVVGEEKAVTVILENRDERSKARIDGIEVTGAFTVDRSACADVLDPGGTCALLVTFAPTALGDSIGSLAVTSHGQTIDTSLGGAGGWSLEVAPTASGTITSEPAGLDCGATCTGIFVDPVTLHFAPISSQSVIAWSVPGCTGLTCEVAPAIPRVVATVQAVPAQQVVVTHAGNGAGSVASTPSGIACGTSCTGLFVDAVTLTATPALGSVFAGWSTPSCGTGSVCELPAGTGTTAVEARFELSELIINVTFAGAGPGEVVAFQSGVVVARCQGSCTMTVPPLETIVAADTPYDYGGSPLTGTGCDGDRCTIPVGAGDATITSHLAMTTHDDWTFMGDPGERFATGAFDSANNLIASSQQRMIKLDPTGAIVWSLPPVEKILAAPGSAFYTWTASGGTTKRDASGATLWTIAGTLQAVDMTTGNVLVHPDATTMTLVLASGTPLWSVPGQGTDIDASGVVYEPYAVTYIPNAMQPLEHAVAIRVRRYSSAGSVLTELPREWQSGILYGPYQTGFRVSGDRIAGLVSFEGDITGELDLDLGTPIGDPFLLHLDASRILTEPFRARLAAATNGLLGLLHDQIGLLPFSSFDYDYTFGFHLYGIARDGMYWTLSRLAPARFVDGHGVAALALAGGASDRFAVLGWYRPVVAGGMASGPDRGFIQAFTQ